MVLINPDALAALDSDAIDSARAEAGSLYAKATADLDAVPVLKSNVAVVPGMDRVMVLINSDGVTGIDSDVVDLDVKIVIDLVINSAVVRLDSVVVCSSDVAVEFALDVPVQSVLDSDRMVVMDSDVVATMDSAMIMMRDSG